MQRNDRINKAKYLRIEYNREKKRLKKLFMEKNSANSFKWDVQSLKSLFEKTSFGFGKKNQKIRTEKYRVVIPQFFSFAVDPEETIRTCQNVVSCFANRKVREIEFDFSKCEQLDLCATTVLDVLIIRLRLFKEMNFSGNFPLKDRDRLTMLKSGLVKHLGLEEVINCQIQKVPISEIKNDNGEKYFGVKTLELLEKKDFENEATQKIIRYFEGSIEEQGYSFNEEAIKMLMQALGEVVDNCIDHGELRNQYFCLGHYYAEAGSYGECNLVIFNFGKTISESIQDSKDQDLLNKINEFINIQKPFFSFDWDPEKFYTLFALQDGVSSKRSLEDPDRGSGTVKLIKMFQNLKRADNEPPKMSITSGNTSIIFDGKYQIKENYLDDGTMRLQIAFNEDNDLKKPPDLSVVRTIKSFFPGTVIGIKFYVDRAYLENKNK